MIRFKLIDIVPQAGNNHNNQRITFAKQKELASNNNPIKSQITSKARYDYLVSARKSKL